MDWVCERGACILIPSGPGSKKHAFVVAIGPRVIDGRGSKNQVVLVSFVSVQPDFPSDDACLVHKGEHSFITHESYVLYRAPRIEPVDHVNAMVASRVWVRQDPCSASLLARIVAGFDASNRVPRYIRDLL